MKNYYRASRAAAFSLIEMLIVLTVLGVLFAVAAPNLFTLMQASSLSSEGSLVRNKLTQAQQLALSRNSDVEVRFFKMRDEGAAELDEEYRGFQFYQYDSAGKLSPVSRFFRIRPPVVISSELSTLLKESSNQDEQGKDYGFISPNSGRDTVPLGDGFEELDYVAFRFRPDGSTDLPGRSGTMDSVEGGDTWYLTLVQGAGDVRELPPNYYVVQLDPFNGRVGVYRP
jgi:uncharacterized protein (TIGR02596 family)